MRKLFKAPPDTKDVDSLFKSLDVDGGGELDMSELKAALKQMIAAYANRKAAGASAMVKVAAKREQAKALREGSIAAAVRASEAAVTTLQELRKISSIDSQLGDIINSKGWKASDVATKWDASGDGELDQKEVSGYLPAASRYYLPSVTLVTDSRHVTAPAPLTHALPCCHSLDCTLHSSGRMCSSSYPTARPKPSTRSLTAWMRTAAAASTSQRCVRR